MIMVKITYRTMIIAGLVVSFLAYSVYLYANLPIGTRAQSKMTARGKALWQQYNCNACHQVYGLGGYLGPDLTNVYSLKGAVHIQAFLKSGTVTMPDFHLTDEEITSIISYLQHIDGTGKSDPRTFTINNDGTIEQ